MTVRVLVAEDQPLTRTGLLAVLDLAPELTVVGEAADGAQAVALAAETRPHVILMDIKMPVLDGITATRRILQNAGDEPPAIIMLTTFDVDEYIYTALGTGAAGFLLKDTPPAQIISAVKVVAEGSMLITPSVTRRLVESHAQQHLTRTCNETALAKLTAREREVLRLVGRGLTNLEVSQQLHLSEETVKTHVKRIMHKMKLSSRAQAVVTAYETGLVVPGE
ncbi:response regulator [Jidongwangia harbinensis]|uniref:response regulator n=1 Tax=Jidongwangia harbinensis TaxID=2878561 RepID=UPI001CD962FA|nr:response regulator transcription factor [Jidongwangia harbinensis]MCA2217478.1 response regulator transcription factor [Jidongwangia harbinensis]